jgi:hypothetical protein
MPEYQYHEACLALPRMKPAQFRELVEDIRQHGLRESIVVWGGMVIDGRSRLEACEEAGREPHFKHWDGNGTIAEFVASENLKRRHLTKSQLGMIGATLKKMFEKESEERRLANLKKGQGISMFPDPAQKADSGKNGGSTARAAKILDVSPRTVERGSRLQEQAAPEVAEAVRNGDLSLNEAERHLIASRDQSPRDEAGAVIPESLKDVFDGARQFESALSYVARAKGLMEKVAALPCGAALRLQAHVQVPLEKVHRDIRFARPFTSCPNCHGTKCKSCENRGWLTELEWKLVVPEIKAAHLSRQANADESAA